MMCTLNNIHETTMIMKYVEKYRDILKHLLPNDDNDKFEEIEKCWTLCHVNVGRIRLEMKKKLSYP